MTCKKTNFLLGMAIGSAIGCLTYRFCQTQKAKDLKQKVCDALRNAGNKAGEVLDDAKEKATSAGYKAADKVSDKAYEYANKMDNKVNNK